MLYGMSGGPLPANLPYAQDVIAACGSNFPPLVAYSVAARETIMGQLAGEWNAATVVSGDGGHGLFQLTSSFPSNWQDPQANARYAMENWLVPDMNWWRSQIPGLQGDDLIRCIAASFNAGRGGAWRGHQEGSIDLYTTDNYGSGVLSIYKSLFLTGKFPTG